jgi:hypothetical protein
MVRDDAGLDGFEGFMQLRITPVSLPSLSGQFILSQGILQDWVLLTTSWCQRSLTGRPDIFYTLE